MHDRNDCEPGAGPDVEDRERGTTDAAPALHVPAAGPSGDLTVLERLEAFRDLIRHGNALLGEVVSYCRAADAAVTQIAAEKLELDRMRANLQETQARADGEAAAARKAMQQVDALRRELSAMRGELVKARAEMEQVQAAQRGDADALEQSLREARLQQRQLEQELQRVRAQAASPRSIDSRLAQLDEMETRMRGTERELAETRRALEEERGRRDRAIALIKPKQTTASSS